MFHPFQKFLQKAAGEYSFTKQMKAIQVCQEYRNIAPGLLPEGALKETFPKSFDEARAILTIGIYNSMWAQVVTMKRQQIMEGINQKFGTDAVKTVRVEVCEKTEENG